MHNLLNIIQKIYPFIGFSFSILTNENFRNLFIYGSFDLKNTFFAEHMETGKKLLLKIQVYVRNHLQ